MIVITEELIEQFVKEYIEKNGYSPDEGPIQSMKNNFIGLHIDEKEINKFFDACYELYYEGYDEGYRDG